jgi:hypothetical protein
MDDHTGMHDGTAGTLILPGILLGAWGSAWGSSWDGSWWLLLPGAPIPRSASTGFCPVYFTLGKPGRSQAG